jgi:hypothetical protein
MTTIITIEKDNKEVRSVQARRDSDKERARDEKAGIIKRHYIQPEPNDILQKEIRSVQYSGMDKIKKYNKRYFDISIPKSYARIFKINKGDLFVWDIVRTEPLTFSLRKINTEGDSA